MEEFLHGEAHRKMACEVRCRSRLHLRETSKPKAWSARWGKTREKQPKSGSEYRLLHTPCFWTFWVHIFWHTFASSWKIWTGRLLFQVPKIRHDDLGRIYSIECLSFTMEEAVLWFLCLSRDILDSEQQSLQIKYDLDAAKHTEAASINICPHQFPYFLRPHTKKSLGNAQTRSQVFGQFDLQSREGSFQRKTKKNSILGGFHVLFGPNLFRIQDFDQDAFATFHPHNLLWSLFVSLRAVPVCSPISQWSWPNFGIFWKQLGKKLEDHMFHQLYGMILLVRSPFGAGFVCFDDFLHCQECEAQNEVKGFKRANRQNSTCIFSILVPLFRYKRATNGCQA